MEVHCQFDLVHFTTRRDFPELKVLYAENTLYAYLDALVMMVTDESLFMFSQLGGLLCQLAAAASQVGVLTRTTASGPRPVAERTRASARRPSSLRPLSRSAAVAVTSAYTLTKLLRKSRVSSEDVSICLHYGQSNDLIENATGLRGCEGEKLTRHQCIFIIYSISISTVSTFYKYFTIY